MSSDGDVDQGPESRGAEKHRKLRSESRSLRDWYVKDMGQGDI